MSVLTYFLLGLACGWVTMWGAMRRDAARAEIAELRRRLQQPTPYHLTPAYLKQQCEMDHKRALEKYQKRAAKEASAAAHDPKIMHNCIFTDRNELVRHNPVWWNSYTPEQLAPGLIIAPPHLPGRFVMAKPENDPTLVAKPTSDQRRAR